MPVDRDALRGDPRPVRSTREGAYENRFPTSAEEPYFLSFHSNAKDMNGLLDKSGADLNLSVADDAAREVQSPENYTFTIGIKPRASSQAIHLATGDQKKVVKAWGLAVA
jgi:hypothetical protein